MQQGTSRHKSFIEQGSLHGTTLHFLSFKGTSTCFLHWKVTSSHFLYPKVTTEATSSCFLHWKGTLECMSTHFLDQKDTVGATSSSLQGHPRGTLFYRPQGHQKGHFCCIFLFMFLEHVVNSDFQSCWWSSKKCPVCPEVCRARGTVTESTKS